MLRDDEKTPTRDVLRLRALQVVVRAKPRSNCCRGKHGATFFGHRNIMIGTRRHRLDLYTSHIYLFPGALQSIAVVTESIVPTCTFLHGIGSHSPELVLEVCHCYFESLCGKFLHFRPWIFLRLDMLCDHGGGTTGNLDVGRHAI